MLHNFCLAITALCLGAASAQAQGKLDLMPYAKSGVVNCALPGTTVEFFLDGKGRARVTSAKSNYVGFRNAVQRKIWTAGTTEKDGTRLMVIDNEANSRIMIKLPNGNGFAFLADGGVSDIICQVLVSP